LAQLPLIGLPKRQGSTLRAGAKRTAARQADASRRAPLGMDSVN
jgi:hypothetical protein